MIFTTDGEGIQFLENFKKKDDSDNTELFEAFAKIKEIWDSGSTDDFNNALNESDEHIKNYVQSCQDGEISTKGFTESLKGMSKGANLGQVALKGLVTVGNALAGAIISWGISKIIGGIVTAIDNAIHTFLWSFAINSFCSITAIIEFYYFSISN